MSRGTPRASGYVKEGKEAEQGRARPGTSSPVQGVWRTRQPAGEGLRYDRAREVDTGGSLKAKFGR